MADDHDAHFHEHFGMPDGSSLRSPFDKVADAMGEVLNRKPTSGQTVNTSPPAVDRRSDPAFAAKVRAAQAAQAKRGG